MGKVYLLLGKSNVGKDFCLRKIMELFPKLQKVIPTTSRPPRQKEVEGIDYYFKTQEEMKEMYENDEFAELRSYSVVQKDGKPGLWFYGTEKSQIDLTSNFNYIMIGTVEAYESVADTYGAKNVVPIYIYALDDLRLERAIHRETYNGTQNYKEVCRRYLQDEEDFIAADISKFPNIKYIENSGPAKVTIMKLEDLGNEERWYKLCAATK